MNILIIMDPGIPVPPVKYGGIERIVYLLANAYQANGHMVTLLAGPDSYCDGKTLHFGMNKLDRSKWAICKEVLYIWSHLIHNRLPSKLTNKNHQYDVIHNFGKLLYLLPSLQQQTVKIMSYQRRITLRNIRLLNLLRPDNFWFTACSDQCRRFSFGPKAATSSSIPISGHKFEKPSDFSNWRTIYNAVDFSKYQPNYSLDEDAPLMFLGRLEHIKGVHIAIEVAKRTNRKLWIAGNIPQRPDALSYFQNEITSHIDGQQIIYLGALDDQQKTDYLSKSAALLFPIEWDEPFGIVMIEAMACGTPVIAFNRGSVPEVVISGETGLIVNGISEMCSAIPQLGTIDRLNCRYAAMAKFDISVIAGQYLALARHKHAIFEYIGAKTRKNIHNNITYN